MTTPVHWLNRLAHDLRGPLMPLQTAAHLLRSGQVEGERQQELFAVIERQTRQLVRMIDELGDWTRSSQGILLGLRERCESSLLLDYARVGSGAAGAAAVVDDLADAAVVHGDPMRLTQALRILIEYATARGKAPVTIALQTVDDRLRIDVRDAGPSPDPAQLAVLLEEPQDEPYDEGLGLRLLIARAIAEAHGGSLIALADGNHLLLRCELPLAETQSAPQA
jgi:signal transduction histidine kinase